MTKKVPSSSRSILLIGTQTIGIADALARLRQGQTVIGAEHGKPGAAVAFAQGVNHLTLDVTDEQAVRALFARFDRAQLLPELVIILPPRAQVERSRHPAVSEIEQQWRLTAYSAFLIAQAAIRGMQKEGGTVIFAGSMSDKLADADEAARFAGLRTLAQSLSREFQPQGIHIAHVQQAGEEHAEALAALIDQLHCQPRDVWSHEVDLTA